MNSQKAIFVLLVALFALATLVRETATPSDGRRIAAVLVEDTAHPTVAGATLRAAPEIQAAVAAGRISWHVVDMNEKGPDAAEVQWAIDAVKKKKSPLPAIVTRNGTADPRISPVLTVATARDAIRSLSGN